MNKIAVVTGTSSGLGFELALLLARNNYIVYATMRVLDKQNNLLKYVHAENLDIRIVALDVTDNNSIEKCFKQILNQSQHLDLLINNAGAGFIRSTEQATLSEIEWVMNTNYLSVVKCTKAVLSQMRIQRSGHIINIGSIGGLVGQPFNELYCGAKFAVEGFTESLASYMTHAFNINFTVIEPGGISSEFAKSIIHSIQKNGGIYQDEYQEILQRYLDSSSSRKDAGIYQTPDTVAKVIYSKVISADIPPVRIRTSQWAESLCELKTGLDPDGHKLKSYIEDNFLGYKS